MNHFIFEHYVNVAQIAIVGALPVMLVAILVKKKAGRLRAAAVALLAYVAIVSLGMSGDIKNLSLVGIAHALIAFFVAGLAVRHLAVRAGWLLWLPCFFIVIVLLFNMANENVGLELMGRWNRGSVGP